MGQRGERDWQGSRTQTAEGQRGTSIPATVAPTSSAASGVGRDCAEPKPKPKPKPGGGPPEAADGCRVPPCSPARSPTRSAPLLAPAESSRNRPKTFRTHTHTKRKMQKIEHGVRISKIVAYKESTHSTRLNHFLKKSVLLLFALLTVQPDHEGMPRSPYSTGRVLCGPKQSHPTGYSRRLPRPFKTEETGEQVISKLSKV